MFGRRKRMLADLDRDIRDHIARETQDNMDRGMSPEDAHYAALRKFGNIRRVKEDTRAIWIAVWLEQLAQDARFGLRMLRKSPGFTIVAVVTLALGIGASTVVFSAFYNLLFNAFAARDAARLVVPMGEGTEPLSCTLDDIEAIRAQNQVFEDIAGFEHEISLVSYGQETRQLQSSRVTANAFDFYGVPAFLGRGVASEDGMAGAAPVFVLGYNAWKNEFNADMSVLGRHFTVDGEPRTLVGVMPPRFQAFGALQQMWIPFDAVGAARSPQFVSQQTSEMLARLKPGVSLATASANLDVIVKRLTKMHPEDFPKNFTARVVSATDFLMGPYGIGGAGGSEYGFKSLLFNLLAAVMILLLIACSNVANLLFARATVREKEIAVRSALGATRGRLIRQLLVESAVLALGACVVGCAFAYFGTKGAASMIPHKGLSIGGEVVIGLNPIVLLFALGVTMLTVVLCGLAPALHSLSSDLNSAMAGSRKGTNGGARRGRLRSVLVIGEVALSIVLLVGAGLVIRSFYVLTHVDIGFDPKHLLIAAFGNRDDARTPEQNEALLTSILQKLRALPGVSEAALNYSLIGYNGGAGSKFTVAGAARSGEGGVERCGASLFQTLGLRLLRGRWFTEGREESASHVAVINETLARSFFGDADPVGKQLEVRPVRSDPRTTPAESYEIIGVAADVKNFGGPKQPVRPMAYVPYGKFTGFVVLVRTNEDPRSMMRAVQQQIWNLDSSMIFYQFEPIEETLDKLTYSTPRFGVAALAPLAGIGLLLVVIGIFSTMAYTVSLRTHEIGIRMALGAQPSNVSQMILVSGARLIAVGSLIGFLVSQGLTRFLSSQIWGIPSTDPWTFGGVIALILIVGIAACYIPARRAMRVDPMIALRHE